MKKLIMIAVMAVVAASASAQVYVGGGLGFNYEKGKEDGAKSTTQFNIKPEVGYTLTEKWAVGMQIGLTSEKKEDCDALTGFSVEPYARYTFASIDKVSFFVDGGVGYETFGKDKGNEFRIGVRPGVNFNVAEGINVRAKLGYLGYKTQSEEADNKNKFGFNVDGNTLELGIFFDL